MTSLTHKPMRLGINGIRLVCKRSGVARAIEAFLRNLDVIEHPFTDIPVYTPLPLGDDIHLPRGAHNVVLPSRLPYGLWEQITLPRAHGRDGLLLCPSYVSPILARCPTFVIHHGSYEGFPSAFDWWTLNKARIAYALSAWTAAGVSTVSEYSRQDMKRYYGIAAEQVSVVPEGVDTSQFRPLRDPAMLSDWRRSVFGEDVPFIAYVGKPTERRNLSNLLRAYAKLRSEQGLEHRFLIVGADLPGTSPFRQVIEELEIGELVTVIGHASHEEIAKVYNACSLLAYPSSYEGFGMPVLEAMACGAPVLALHVTAIPEFAGGVAHLLPDARVETLAEGMHRILSDDALRARMLEEGPRRAAAYDWRVVTQRYLDLLIPLAQGMGSSR